MNSVASVAFSPDGKILAAASAAGGVWLWNLVNPAHPASLGQLPAGPGNGGNTLAFSPDQNILAVGGGSEVWLWNLSDPALPTELGQPLTSFAFIRRFDGVQPGREDLGRRWRQWHGVTVEPGQPGSPGPPQPGPDRAHRDRSPH